jgi:hypothetical protein
LTAETFGLKRHTNDFCYGQAVEVQGLDQTSAAAEALCLAAPD